MNKLQIVWSRAYSAFSAVFGSGLPHLVKGDAATRDVQQRMQEFDELMQNVQLAKIINAVEGGGGSGGDGLSGSFHNGSGGWRDFMDPSRPTVLEFVEGTEPPDRPVFRQIGWTCGEGDCGRIHETAADELARAVYVMEGEPTPPGPHELNEWFLSLPPERQKILIEDKWMLAAAAFAAARQTSGDHK